MQTEDRLGHLLIIAATLFASLVFAIVSVATGGWSNRIQTSLLQFYQASGLLWAVGCVVLIILGIICLSLSAIILFARFFNHGKGRAILGGVLSIFSGNTPACYIWFQLRPVMVCCNPCHYCRNRLLSAQGYRLPKLGDEVQCCRPVNPFIHYSTY
uniref:Epithelial membrane protein 3-like n=1 Tax=Phallusia mammillata TaxID=59560 RepID=A0A6F9DBC0_9ASCI|nr:epithelial membrane protein 3-like [Phallusia mammillata]